MLSPARCVSEPVTQYGAVVGDLAPKVLKSGGSLGKWTVFARETFQNSNDQRLTESSSIDFEVRLTEVPNEAKQFLKDSFGSEGPFNSDSNLGLGPKTDFKNMLLVIDSNTKGLSGSRDPRLAENEQSNFNNFFFFTGQLQQKTSGGGTYGIGRNVLFQASLYRTIFVYSSFIADGQVNRIFQGMSVSAPFDQKGFRYTGKHWWGKTDDNDPSKVISPYEDDEALEIAKYFDLDKHLQGKTGTVIAILEPDLKERDAEMREIADAMLINSWPHLLPDSSGEKSTKIKVFVGDEEIVIPEPSSPDSPVRDFVLAYQASIKGRHIWEEEIHYRGSLEHLKPFKVRKKLLGKVRWVASVLQGQEINAELQEKHLRLGFVPTNSIALMRGSKTIVKYMPIAKSADGTTLQGIFMADEDYEQLFRASENATHDDWQSSALNLPRGLGDPVRQLKEKISDLFSKLTSQGTSVATQDELPIEAAEWLGKIIEGLGVTGGTTPSPGPGPRPGPGPSPVGTRGIKFRLIQNPQIKSKTSDYCEGDFLFSPTTEGVSGQSYLLEINPRIWLGDRYEDTAPAGEAAAEVKLVAIQSNPSAGPLALDPLAPVEGAALKPTTVVVVTVRYPLNVQISCSLQALLEKA